MILFSVIISSASLFVAILMFYLTQIKPSKISILIGPEIQIYHANYPEISTGIYVPMTFINSSPNLGAIFKCGISIFKSEEPEQRFFFLWEEFSKPNSDRNWIHDENAHSFAVSGKTSISKAVWYLWSNKSSPKLYFKQGNYSLIVHIWIGKNKKPKNTTFNFYISQEDEEYFQNRIKEQSSTVRKIMLNKDIDGNRILTTHESIALLG